MQELEKWNLSQWQERKTIWAAQILLITNLVYYIGKDFWRNLESMSGFRIYRGILLCDGIVLVGVLLGYCAKLILGKKEEGVFIRGVKICFLLLLMLGLLGFMDTLLFFQ